VGEVNRVQDIYYGVAAQTLYYDATSRPSAIATCEVFEARDGDDATAEVATSGAASISSVNTTFDAASGNGQSDPRVCHLTATTGITIGGRYLLTNATSDMEWGEVVDITSTVSVTLRHPLRNAYASADTFVSTRMSKTISSTWVADENNVSSGLDPNPRYRVRWAFTNGAGVTEVRAGYFDLVRYSATYTVTGLDVDDMFPGFLDTLPTRYREDQGASLIDAAYHQGVKIDLHQEVKADQQQRNQEVIDILVIHKANELAQEVRLQRGGGSVEAVEVARLGYQERFNHLIKEPKILFDVGDEGGGVKVTRTPIFRR
jgi:hypothetical protein